MKNVEQKIGVGLLLVNYSEIKPEILTIIEHNTNYSTHKITGMRSFPMETLEPNENDQDAIRRLLEEEITTDLDISRLQLLSQVEIRPRVILRGYFLETAIKPTVNIGNFKHEVSSPKWLLIDEILHDPIGSLRFRPGVKEMLTCYQTYKTSQEVFCPKFIGYSNLFEYIPEHLYESKT